MAQLAHGRYEHTDTPVAMAPSKHYVTPTKKINACAIIHAIYHV